MRSFTSTRTRDMGSSTSTLLISLRRSMPSWTRTTTCEASRRPAIAAFNEQKPGTIPLEQINARTRIVMCASFLQSQSQSQCVWAHNRCWDGQLCRSRAPRHQDQSGLLAINSIRRNQALRRPAPAADLARIDGKTIMFRIGELMGIPIGDTANWRLWTLHVQLCIRGGVHSHAGNE